MRDESGLLIFDFILHLRDLNRFKWTGPYTISASPANERVGHGYLEQFFLFQEFVTASLSRFANTALAPVRMTLAVVH
jgi:hypothetical protein